MTPRQQRGLEISARERDLRAQQSAFDQERNRIRAETGQQASARTSEVSEQEQAVRSERRALAAERARLLAEISTQEAPLRRRQAAFQSSRAAARMPGRGKTTPVTKAGQELRAQLATLQSERSHVDGSVWRARESAGIADAIWDTCHDPESFGAGDW